MSNLAKKNLLKSTVFRFAILTNLFCAILYISGGITGSDLMTVFMTTFAAYVGKEGIAKSAEAYRDRKQPQWMNTSGEQSP